MVRPVESSRPAPRDRQCVLHLTEQEYELLYNLALIRGEHTEDFIRQAALNRAEQQRITWVENKLIPYLEDVMRTRPDDVEEIHDATSSILNSLKLYKRVFLS